MKVRLLLPKLFLVLGGIGGCLLFFLILELFLKQKIFDRQFYEPQENFYRWTRISPGLNVPCSGTHAVFENDRDGKQIYEATYTIDQFHRRISPVPFSSSRNKYICFFGCSFLFGNGLQDVQTLPSTVGNLTNEYSPYNYGVPGWGPFDILAKLETADFTDEIKESKGIVIYVFIYPHIRRLYYPLSTYSWLRGGTCYESQADGTLQRRQNFKKTYPVRSFFFKFLSQLRIVKLLKIDIPPSSTQRHLHMLHNAITNIAEQVKIKFPQSNFYVLVYPVYPTLKTPKAARDLQKIVLSLKSAGIKCLDYTDLFDNQGSLQDYVLSLYDRHPNAASHLIVAKKIVADLGLD